MDIAQMLLQQPLDGTVEPLEKIRAQSAQTVNRRSPELEKLEATAKQFEAVFINEIMKQMQETIKNSSLDPEDGAGQQIHSMFCSYMADAAAQRGGFGLWEQIYEKMVQMNEPSLTAYKETLSETM